MTRRGRPPKGKEKLWSYSVGKRGRDRVRVYEPRPGGALMIAYRTPEGGLQREALSQWAETPVYCRDTAERIATRISSRLADARDDDQLRGFLGLSKRRTLKELLDSYHEAKEEGWSEAHRNDQRRWRQTFLEFLGEDRQIHQITPAEVESVVVEELGDLSPSRRKKALQYMSAVYRFAQRKLKWLSEEDNLSAISFPRVEANVGVAYSRSELDRLIPAMTKVDPRAGFVGEMMSFTARRLNATKQLTVGDCSRQLVELPSGQVRTAWIVQFVPEHDKAERTSRIPLSTRAAELLEMLLKKPAVQATGMLCPSGDLDDPATISHHRGKPVPRPVIDHSDLNRMLHEAEALAGIEHISGRAFHGIKRAVVTRSLGDAVPIDVLAALSGTNAATLRGHYTKLDRDVGSLLAWVGDRSRTRGKDKSHNSRPRG